MFKKALQVVLLLKRVEFLFKKALQAKFCVKKAFLHTKPLLCARRIAFPKTRKSIICAKSSLLLTPNLTHGPHRSCPSISSWTRLRLGDNSQNFNSQNYNLPNFNLPKLQLAGITTRRITTRRKTAAKMKI